MQWRNYLVMICSCFAIFYASVAASVTIPAGYKTCRVEWDPAPPATDTIPAVTHWLVELRPRTSADQNKDEWPDIYFEVKQIATADGPSVDCAELLAAMDARVDWGKSNGMSGPDFDRYSYFMLSVRAINEVGPSDRAKLQVQFARPVIPTPTPTPSPTATPTPIPTPTPTPPPIVERIRLIIDGVTYGLTPELP